MAKKAAVQQASKVDLLEQVRKDIVAKYKTDSMLSSGSEIIDKEIKIISTGSPLLDQALNGGIPEGCFVGFSGKPKLGKTSQLLATAAQAQKIGKIVIYVDAEHRLKKMNLSGCKGLDLSPDKFIRVGSDEDRILSSQDFLGITEMYIKTIPDLFVIIDSVSCLVDSRIMEGGLGTETRGSGSKLLSQFVDLIAPYVPIQRTNVCSVSHIIADTSGKSMTGTMEKNANRLIYQADVRVKATHASKWLDGEKQIGQTVHWEIQCSALGGPGKADSWLRYGVGIDDIFETIEIATAINLIDKSGAWYELAYLQEHPDLIDGEVKKLPKFQGGNNLWQGIVDHPAWFELLKSKMKEFFK